MYCSCAYSARQKTSTADCLPGKANKTRISNNKFENCLIYIHDDNAHRGTAAKLHGGYDDSAVSKSSTKINITTKFVEKKGISWGIRRDMHIRFVFIFSVGSI